MAAAEAIHRTTPSAYWPAIRSILEGRLALGLGQVTPDVAGNQLDDSITHGWAVGRL